MFILSIIISYSFLYTCQVSEYYLRNYESYNSTRSLPRGCRTLTLVGGLAAGMATQGSLSV